MVRSCFTTAGAFALILVSHAWGATTSEDKAIYLSMVPLQKGSPILISKAKSTAEYMFEFVTVTNKSDRTITAIELGVVSRIKDLSGAPQPLRL
jgi:hypothetical protein